MSEPDENVKPAAGHNPLERGLSFIDHHPRLGWYLCAITTLNFLLTLLQIFH